MADQCGAPYGYMSVVVCTLPRNHPHKPYHRNGSLTWMALKSEYAYLQGNADHEWRELAQALIRGQIAPGDDEKARYWLQRLHKRSSRHEAAERRRREQEARIVENVRAQLLMDGGAVFEYDDVIEPPGSEPGVDAMHWSPE